MNIQIEILNPNVKGILEQLVKLELIKIKDEPKIFLKLISKIRNNSLDDFDVDDIRSEVEMVRNERFEEGQKKDQ